MRRSRNARFARRFSSACHIESLEPRQMLAANLVADLASQGESSDPIGLTQLNDNELVFIATNELGQNQLWKSNGETTELLATIPDPLLEGWNNIDPVKILVPAFNVRFVEFTNNNNDVYFLQGYYYFPRPGDAEDSYDLWKTDGTVDGTTRVEQHAFTFFFEVDGEFDTPLLEFEGGEPMLIPQRLVIPFDRWPGSYRFPGARTVFTETAGYNGSDVPGLWVREDGQEQFLAEFAVDALSNFSSVAGNPGRLFFEVDGRELWETDGSVDGTVLVRTIGETQNVGDKQFLTPTSGPPRLFVTENGNERLVAEFENPLSYLTTFNDRLFFSANENELWQSDGTNAGTRMVATGLAGIRELMVADDLLYFVADDGVHGSEVWQTDGTTAGTVLSADVLAGAIGSQPSGLVSVGDTLYFVAEDGVHGREVWTIRNDTPLAGDIDGDGSVTFADFLVLSSNFGQTTEQGSSVGDIDGDGTVSFSDFLLLSANFGR